MDLMMTDEKWGEVREGLKKSVGASNYRSWIEPLEFDSLDGGVGTFRVATSFHGTYVSQNFGDQILYHLNRSGEQVQRLRFDTAANAPRPPATMSAAELPSTTAADDAEFTPEARLTFDRFVVGKSNELAHAAARRVAEGGPAVFNPLFLYGGVGLGKTHLMHAVAHEIGLREPKKQVLYISAEAFMWRFITAIREKKMVDFKQMFRSVDVLMVDDVQFIAGKDSTQEEFFHTFNYLVDSGKQIIISADRSPADIRELEERIKSRLQCGLVVDLHPADYELRVGILQSKIEIFESLYPGVTIRKGVIEFLAHRIINNVRVLEGAMNRLYAFASLVGHEITVDLAQDCLADIFRASDRKVSIEEILRRVSDHYNIRLSDLTGPKRVRAFARPRQVAMYLCKLLTNRSLPEIGRHIGKRDHTTVIHGVRQIEKLMSTDSGLAEDVELLRRSLEA